MRWIFLSTLTLTLLTMPTVAKAKPHKKSSYRASDSELPKYAAAYKIESLEPNLHIYQISITVQNPEQKPELDSSCQHGDRDAIRFKTMRQTCRSSVQRQLISHCLL